MLSLFKEKLLSVQDGFSISLKSSDKGRITTKRDHSAGARLLAKYQKDWEELHGNSEQNAKEAKVIRKEMDKIHNNINQQRFAIKKFNCDCKDLSNIIVLTETAVNAIGNIRSLIDDVQNEIIVLEDLLETEELIQRKASATQKVNEFRKEQLISFDALRERLAEDYEEKVKRLEREKEEIQKKNFQIAEKKFLKDLTTYKETGELPKKEPAKPTLSIEEVEIDQDLESLQEYLQT